MAFLLPLVSFGAVLTLPATGSEMNSASVITRKATHEKFAFMSRHVYPKFAILDPSKTYSLPTRQVGNGVVDAFAHVMEQYMTYPVGAKVQDRFAEGLLLTLIEEGPLALAHPDDYKVRANVICPGFVRTPLVDKQIPEQARTLVATAGYYSPQVSARLDSGGAAPVDKDAASARRQIEGLTGKIATEQSKLAKALSEAMGERAKASVRASYEQSISAMRAERSALQASLGGGAAASVATQGQLRPGESRAVGGATVKRIN